MDTSMVSDTPDDPDGTDVRGHVLTPAREVESPTVAWPARHFSVDPASSPVLMAAFAWAATPAR